jgi:hypothetical protein
VPEESETELSEDRSLQAYARLARGLFEVARVVQQELRSVVATVVPYLEQARPSLAALAQVDWSAAKQRLDELPKKSKDAMRLALAEGWFFGWHDHLQGVMELVETLGANRSNPLDDIMTAYYRLNLQPFADQLIITYPHRADAIKAAVSAHMSSTGGGYFLSVPVFIAQADGLAGEVTGKSSIAEAGRALRARYADDAEMLDLLHPFFDLHASSFMMSAKVRRESERTSGRSFTALNRHQVMHCEVSDYGTELNSLKAFSFLVFAGLHMPAVLEHNASTRR